VIWGVIWRMIWGGDLGGDLGQCYDARYERLYPSIMQTYSCRYAKLYVIVHMGCPGDARGRCLGDTRVMPKVNLKTHLKKIMLSLSLYCHVFSVGM
jgi:hypothetical protein